MKIMFLKSGKFSIDSVYGPVINCVEGKEIDIGENDAEVLLLSGWACRKDEVEDEEESTFEEAERNEEVKHFIIPWESKDWDINSIRAKDDLDLFSIKVFETSIDRRKSVRNIIKELKEKIEYDR